MELYSAWDYIKFGYLLVYWMIMSIWAYESDSYFGTCNASIIGLKDTIKLFILYTSTPFYESVAGM
jgi:hypothetical protein